MDIYSIFSLCGGLAFFLFGMNVMSGNLKKVTGGQLQGTLQKLTSNPFKGLLFGAVITIAIQSSSALTVMLVGMVNSGIMELSQTVGIIMGSDIGTTLTAWILSLNGIQSDNIFLSLLKPQSFAPIVALIGVILLMAGKTQKRRDLGSIFCGFAVLMYGMTLMSSTVSPLAEMPQFRRMLVAFDNPLAGLLIGTAFTAVIQSSAAAIGVLQALALTGMINFGMAVPLIIGANIGTCVTAMLSAIGVSRKAKRVPILHVSIKVLGAVIWMVLYAILRYPAGLDAFGAPVTSFQVAVFHTIFNIGTIIFLFPFSTPLVKLTEAILPVKAEEESGRPRVLLDRRLLMSPELAVRTCREKTVEMARLARDSYTQSLDVVQQYDKEKIHEIIDMEQYLDYMEDELNSFLVRLSGSNLSERNNKLISEMLHCINDFERISDHAANMTAIAKRIKKDKLKFSESALAELEVLDKALNEILDIMVVSFEQDDDHLALRIEPLEEQIDDLTKDIKNRHIQRLQTGECSSEMGILLNDLLTNCSRVSDHCSNVGVCVVQTRNESFGSHGYMQEIKAGLHSSFMDDYQRYQDKYQLAPFTPKKKKKKDKKSKDKKKKKAEKQRALMEAQLESQFGIPEYSEDELTDMLTGEELPEEPEQISSGAAEDSANQWTEDDLLPLKEVVKSEEEES
ncbi:MAG: Na/Pi cotransporter family protein [Eubacterium sp.]|nr:Na/Pi cotransporter family protein [Eubacterium sp.]